jgi:hypothetical protein
VPAPVGHTRRLRLSRRSSAVDGGGHDAATPSTNILLECRDLAAQR